MRHFSTTVETCVTMECAKRTVSGMQRAPRRSSLLSFGRSNGGKVERESRLLQNWNASPVAKITGGKNADNRRITGGISGAITGKEQAAFIAKSLARSRGLIGIFGSVGLLFLWIQKNALREERRETLRCSVVEVRRASRNSRMRGCPPTLKLRRMRLHSLRERRLADREGFEPSVRSPVRRISSAVPSTTRPPVRGWR